MQRQSTAQPIAFLLESAISCHDTNTLRLCSPARRFCRRAARSFLSATGAVVDVVDVVVDDELVLVDAADDVDDVVVADDVDVAVVVVVVTGVLVVTMVAAADVDVVALLVDVESLAFFSPDSSSSLSSSLVVGCFLRSM